MLLAELQELNITVSMQPAVTPSYTSGYMKNVQDLLQVGTCLQVGMVIDLTNSSRYYSADSDGTSEFEYSGPNPPTVYHRKVLVSLEGGIALHHTVPSLQQ